MQATWLILRPMPPRGAHDSTRRWRSHRGCSVTYSRRAAANSSAIWAPVWFARSEPTLILYGVSGRPVVVLSMSAFPSERASASLLCGSCRRRRVAHPCTREQAHTSPRVNRRTSAQPRIAHHQKVRAGNWGRGTRTPRSLSTATSSSACGRGGLSRILKTYV